MPQSFEVPHQFKELGSFSQNTTIYDTPDLKEVVISRFVKDAFNGFEREQVLELSESELLSIMERKPEVQAKKVIDEKQDTKEVPVVEEEEENFIEPLQHLVKNNLEPLCRKVFEVPHRFKELGSFSQKYKQI